MSTRTRAWLAGLIVTGLAILGIQVTSLASAMTAHDERTPTLQEVKQRVNPHNRPDIVVSSNGDGTFTIRYIYLVPKGTKVLPPPPGGYVSPAINTLGGHR